MRATDSRFFFGASALAWLPMVVAVALGGCEDYDAPPEATLVQPEAGFWTSTSPLTLTFTEPIDPASLVVTIWPNDRDIEGDLNPSATPLIVACTLAAAPCAGLGMSIDDTGTVVTIDQGDVFVADVGVPFIMDIHPGLADRAGQTRNVSTYFDFQINPACGNQPAAISLQTGTMSLTADLSAVLPLNLQMYLDMTVQADNGKVLVIGTFARPIQGAPTNTADPAEFRLQLDPTAWAVLFEGCVVEQAAGEYFFVSEPFDIGITVLQSISVTLTDFKVQGTIKPSSDDGRDTGSGTMSTSGGEFGPIGGNQNPVAAITTAWTGSSFLPEEIPDGLPRACEADPCAEMRAEGGDCQLPIPWDAGAFCEE